MTAHGRAGQMGKRFAIAIGAAALGAAVMAAGASADFRSVKDPRGDTKCTVHCTAQKRRNADIVRATAGHDGALLKHTIRVVGKFREGGLKINTDSDPLCERHLKISRKRSGEVRGCDRGTLLTNFGRARYDFHHHHHSVEIFFSKRSIGNPGSYGWNALAFAGPKVATAEDYVPKRDGYITHRLGDSGVAAAGVMALGAQTAAAPGVVKYDTTLSVTKDGGGDYHGWVKSEVRKCMEGRRVVLFKRRPGADRRLGADRSKFLRRYGLGLWEVLADRNYGHRVRAKVEPKVRDRFVCRADRVQWPRPH
jgi:hypothetical protein